MTQPTITRLLPSLPVDTPKGSALAIFMIWLGEEHNMLWTCIQDETGEIWTFDNKYIRGQKNIQMERIVDNKHLHGDIK